jgi:hypothetical protein
MRGEINYFDQVRIFSLKLQISIPWTLINSISSFSTVRSQLQYVLEIFWDPREWFVSSPNGTTNIFDKSLRYVNHHVGSSGDFFELSRIEMEHLYCIGTISAIAKCFDL